MEKTNNIATDAAVLAKVMNTDQLRRLSALLDDEERPFSLRVRKCGKAHLAELTAGKADLGYYADMLEEL
mgnify:CR=1 FL=1